MMANKSTLLLIPILTIAIVLSLSISNVNAAIVNDYYNSFSIDIPDNWVYQNPSVVEPIVLAPDEFGVLLIGYDDLDQTDTLEKMSVEGAYSTIGEYFGGYTIENGDLDLYTEYQIYAHYYAQVMAKQNATVGGEPAIKIFFNGTDTLANIKFVGYAMMHNKIPYYLEYKANAKDYQKYLPQFEQMVKTFKFTK